MVLPRSKRFGFALFMISPLSYQSELILVDSLVDSGKVGPLCLVDLTRKRLQVMGIDKENDHRH